MTCRCIPSPTDSVLILLSDACSLIRYLDIILKQKAISEVATQQLLLDTYNLKTVLVQMPQFQDTSGAYQQPAVGSSTISKPSAMYLKLINTKTAHIEMILKLLGTPEDMLLERFRIMWPDGQPSDLQLLMSLKGTKRNDQQVILEMLGLSAASKMLNKTASVFGSSTSSTPAIASPPSEASTSSYSSAAASAAALASSSMKSLSLDISSSARNLQRSWNSNSKT